MRAVKGLAIIAFFWWAACGSARNKDRITLSALEDEVTIRIDGRPVLRYAITPQLPHYRFPDSLPAYYIRSGFIHPVYSPAGRIVTDDFPVGHTHQHGIFTAWTSTTFRGDHVDFWNQHQGTGTVRHVELLETFDSASVVGFRARLEQVSLQHGPVLSEDWRVRVYDNAAPYVWDLRSEQTNVSGDTLYLDRYTYGGLGLRGSAEWNESDTAAFTGPARFLTDEGLNRAAANHTRPEWTAIYGDLVVKDGGGTSGVAVFPHPADFRGPQFVRVHPDMPYLSVTPVVEQGFPLAPGETYLARYRFVVFDGAPADIDLAAFGWGSFPRG
ncbi:methane monooxygenase PmoA-like [Neolewinella xylanilytica]|uniref:Methane monooxygenase PmoA-like n=1 Tax=Neolewinella xylanilytica TaxID=1514080 RepID=A0A2S6I6M2_9BACT|nr:PmoA family protein [Neolewinella xylanilytica]PPK87138.1 methane monooxygenase PmoA-like [Neolewinella xylanilytica]